MRALALIGLLLVASKASPEPKAVSPTIELSAVLVEVTWVESDAELKSLRRQHGQPPLEDPVYRSTLSGFAVLGKRADSYVCLLFVKKPERVDDKKTLALGHELAHCLLGAYH